jgi:adenylosuccinate synthase
MEYGTVTGRERRAAPFDYRLARRSVELNGATQIALTKLDVLYPLVKGARQFDELPVEARQFVSKIEKDTAIPVTIIGTGPDEKDIIDRRHLEGGRLTPAVVLRRSPIGAKSQSS